MSEQPATPPDVPTWDTADRIRKALRTAGIGVQEIADYLEVSRTTVSNWINGRIDPPAAAMRLIAMRCGVSYSWLRTGKTGTENDGPTPGPGTTSSFAEGRLNRSLRPVKCAQFSLISRIPLTAGIAA